MKSKQETERLEYSYSFKRKKERKKGKPHIFTIKRKLWLFMLRFWFSMVIFFFLELDIKIFWNLKKLRLVHFSICILLMRLYKWKLLWSLFYTGACIFLNTRIIVFLIIINHSELNVPETKISHLECFNIGLNGFHWCILYFCLPETL